MPKKDKPDSCWLLNSVAEVSGCESFIRLEVLSQSVVTHEGDRECVEEQVQDTEEE